jgi:hypothetical protein
MPNLGLSEAQAAVIADFLLGGKRHEKRPQGVPLWQRLPPPRHRYSVFAFIAGVVCAYLASLAYKRFGLRVFRVGRTSIHRKKSPS